MLWTLAILAFFNVLVIGLLLSGRLPVGIGLRKLLLFVVLGVFPLLWGGTAFSYNFDRVKQVTFCATCHAMEGHVESLTVDDMEPLSALHYQNNFVPQDTACYSCHTGYTWFGPIKGKLNGIIHIYVNYFKGVPDRIEIYDPFPNRDCLRCHGKSRRFREQPVHTRTGQQIERIMDGSFSCLTEGCHDLAHLLPEDWA